MSSANEEGELKRSSTEINRDKGSLDKTSSSKKIEHKNLSPEGQGQSNVYGCQISNSKAQHKSQTPRNNFINTIISNPRVHVAKNSSDSKYSRDQLNSEILTNTNEDANSTDLKARDANTLEGSVTEKSHQPRKKFGTSLIEKNSRSKLHNNSCSKIKQSLVCINNTTSLHNNHAKSTVATSSSKGPNNLRGHSKHLNTNSSNHNNISYSNPKTSSTPHNKKPNSSVENS
jgi:hypothetical protein